MFDRSEINTDIQFSPICVPFSYCKAIAALHKKPEKYEEFLVEYVHEYNPKQKGIVQVGLHRPLLHKLVDCIGWDLRLHRKATSNPKFDINYTFLHDEVSLKIHKLFPVNKALRPFHIQTVIDDPSKSSLATMPRALVNFAFKHEISQGTNVFEDWHSVIVGLDKGGLYIVDPNHPYPFTFNDIYTKYKVLELGEVLLLSI